MADTAGDTAVPVVELSGVDALAPELLQALGGHLSAPELRAARLACKAWATALGVCMPRVTMALPQQASGRVFRQPLVLASSGALNAAHAPSYSAVPREAAEAAVGAAAAAAAAAAAPPARSGVRPSPFATRGGQAALGSAGGLAPAAAPAPAGGRRRRSCSSLQQLTLQLSGAPPSPEDLRDLSSLPHLSHLALRQLDGLPGAASGAHCQPVAEDGEESDGSPAAGSGGGGSCCASPGGAGEALPSVRELANAAAAALAGLHLSCSPPRCGSRGAPSSCASAAGGAASSSGSSSSSCGGGATPAGGSSAGSSSADVALHTSDEGRAPDAGDDAVPPRDQGAAVGTQSVHCSVLTPLHVEALAQLPHLSSLELQPKHGLWDGAASAALLRLSMLTGLTRLSITWGSADAAAASGPLSDAEAVEEAHGAALPLQRCLASLTQLQELELRGAAVLDVAVLHRLQRLRRLRGEALKTVNADVLPKMQHLDAAAAATAAGGGATAAGAAAAGGAPDAARGAGPDQGAPGQGAPDEPPAPRGAAPGSARCRSSLRSRRRTRARTHGRLQALHLVFPKDEAWHSIAVVRLPTALPSLRSLKLEGRFWLPNSLVVGLGVMEVPLEELSLTCKLAVPCLDRLQHLRALRRLALHHVPWSGHPGEGLVTDGIMLQLPAKLVPPGLRELEITNGWILQA
ncbi:hypothetical protein HT031_002105 [Scenedesmus sp. PABB004]|nr:hypothetical protein HT031_002105 [Scenedesmus sp. PABB004]